MAITLHLCYHIATLYSTIVADWLPPLVTKLASNKSDAEAEPSYGEGTHINDSVYVSSILSGEMLDKNGTRRSNPFVSEELLKKLKRYGLSGILSYGLLNTVYYSTAFLLVWFYVAPEPGKMGYLAAAERFLKVMAMVWAGSQVTKLIRIGGAVALAPIVDRGLSWFTVKCKFESQGKAFGALVGICLGLALMLFVVVTLLWA
ncbi:PREDICTED: uncharacterized protein LOC104792676 isoform X6 [Camelina sativa]|uniref:Uncharacterized protein LOC104792676 isoform X5 n=1 Tax=Camelina sativa TaxID=90675 RepID=A0ABM0ZKY1_CAMSA|nr:PREDICTED: uncharacterized protein LOC104792676 isoform X5 [Camelina sativa]XP_019102526.1 PREDICTED: uncharacterized protein LOC104792676 isoform X6 [Camelina sativa]